MSFLQWTLLLLPLSIIIDTVNDNTNSRRDTKQGFQSLKMRQSILGFRFSVDGEGRRYRVLSVGSRSTGDR